MLVISRKKNGIIVLTTEAGETIKLKVLGVGPDRESVRLGIEAPESVRIDTNIKGDPQDAVQRLS